MALTGILRSHWEALASGFSLEVPGCPIPAWPWGAAAGAALARLCLCPAPTLGDMIPTAETAMEQAHPPRLHPAPLLQAALHQCPLYGSTASLQNGKQELKLCCTLGHVPTQT